MWIKCEEGLPETPKTYNEWRDEKKDYVVAMANDYLQGTFYYQSTNWCDGWNCSMKEDGTICREYEFKDVVAWFEIPEFRE